MQHSSNRYAIAGSLVLEKPDSKSMTTSRTDGGNLQLMEARLIELQSSLRALYRSNEELQQFIDDDDSSNNDNQEFLDAIEENWTAMRNQRTLAIELVSEMKQRGVNIDLPDDICEMKIPPVTTKRKEKSTQESSMNNNATATGIYL